MSSSSSSSSSGSFLLNNPQTDLQTQISQFALSQFNNIMNMANDAYGKASGWSDQVIPALINMGQQAAGAGSAMWNRYQSTYMPLENQLIKDANSYASQNRISQEMGSAEAGQQQAGAQGLQQATQALQSYGIDPSSGRYADLVQANKAQTAAAAAGAGQQARLNTEATGRALRAQAIQVGQQYPGQAANFMNSATNANATAANAADALANTRANLLQVPNQYLQTAMQVRPPPVGNQSRSQTQSNTPSRQSNSGNGNGSGQQSSFNDPNANHAGPSNNGPTMVNAPPTNANTAGNGLDDAANQIVDGGSDSPVNGPTFDQYSSNNNEFFGGQNDPLSGNYSADQPYTDISYSPNNQDATQQLDMGSAPSDWASYDNQGSASDSVWNSTGDSYSGSDWTGDSGDMSSIDYGGDYAARGDVGAIDDGSSRMVPPEASPSGGQQTDDVKANLNVHEFVVPQDVALWKGQEFFQNLIKQSREKRMQATAQAQPGPTRPGPVRFSTTG